MDNYAVWVRGDVSKLGGVASICPLPADQFMVSAFLMNYPGATHLDCKELDKLPRLPSCTRRVVRRPTGPLLDTKAIAAPQGCHTHAPYLWHERVVPAAYLQTLDRLRAGASCSMVALRQQDYLHLAVRTYSLTNSKLLPQLCHLLLQKNRLVAAQGQ